MAMNRLRDRDRLDGSSNTVIWKAKIQAVLYRHRIKDFSLKVVVIPIDPAENEKCEEAMARAECMILDEVKDPIIPHISENTTTREMWKTLTTLYQGSSV